jgi:hypothetical protein
MINREPAPPTKRARAPIFVVRAPRSGTTLLRVILNRHPQLAMLHGRVYNRRAAFGDLGDLRNRQRVVSAYLAIEPMRRLKTDVNFLHERMMRDGATWPALFESMLQAWADLQGKPYAGEKTPLHCLHAKTLCEWFPQGSVIHLVRDPRSMVGALQRMPGASHSAYMGARMWRLLNAAARTASVHPNYLLVKYEDFVTRPEEQLRQLCDHVCLEYDDAMLRPDPAEIPTGVNRRSYQGVTPGRIDLWREELKPWQVSAVEAAAGPGMEEYGYRREANRVVFLDQARAAAEAVVENLFQLVRFSPGFFYRLFQPTNLAAEEKWIGRFSRRPNRGRSPPSPRWWNP